MAMFSFFIHFFTIEKKYLVKEVKKDKMKFKKCLRIMLLA